MKGSSSKHNPGTIYINSGDTVLQLQVGVLKLYFFAERVALLISRTALFVNGNYRGKMISDLRNAFISNDCPYICDEDWNDFYRNKRINSKSECYWYYVIPDLICIFITDEIFEYSYIVRAPVSPS